MMDIAGERKAVPFKPFLQDEKQGFRSDTIDV